MSFIKLAISAAAAITAVCSSTPAQAMHSYDDPGLIATIPADYCVTDISMRGSEANNANFKYDEVEGGVRVGYPLVYFDAKNGSGDETGAQFGGYAALSLLIGKIETKKCLEDVLLTVGTRGQIAAPPEVTTGDKWKGIGWVHITGAWLPGVGGIFDRPVGALFTRKMSGNTQRIVTGFIAENRALDCTAAPARSTARCLGGIRGEGMFGNSFINLRLTTSPYVKPAVVAPAIESVSGKWEQVMTCPGCPKLEYKYKHGKTEGREVSKESETSRQLTVALETYAGTGGNAPVQSSITVNVSGTIGEAERNAIVKSFASSMEKEETFECDKGAIWLFVTKLTFEGGDSSIGNTNAVVCTTLDDKPNPDQMNNIDWTGKPKP